MMTEFLFLPKIHKWLHCDFFLFCSIIFSQGLIPNNSIHAIKLVGNLIITILSQTQIFSKLLKKIINLISLPHSSAHLKSVPYYQLWRLCESSQVRRIGEVGEINPLLNNWKTGSGIFIGNINSANLFGIPLPRRKNKTME